MGVSPLSTLAENHYGTRLGLFGGLFRFVEDDEDGVKKDNVIGNEMAPIDAVTSHVKG